MTFFSTISTYFNTFPYAKQLWFTVIRQLFLKHDFSITLLAFTFTRTGHDFVKNEIHLKMILPGLKKTLCYYLHYTNQYANAQQIVQLYRTYICDDIPNEALFYWDDLQTHHGCYDLAPIANQLMHIPCSEAAIERLFSHLSYFFNSHNKHTKEDLIDYRLTIKMNYIFQHAEKPRFNGPDSLIDHYANNSTYKMLSY